MLALITILGLLIGSFLNVCICRIPKDESISFPGSHCTSCGKSLKPVDLIPVLSYAFLRGKCRYCGTQISMVYPIVELLNAFLYALLFSSYGLTPALAAYSLLCSVLIVATFIDLKHQIIPDRLIVILLIAGVGFALYQNGFRELLGNGIGLVLGGGIFLLIAVLTGGAMGGGDIKLMAALGLWFGWKTILLLSLLAFVIGALVSVVLMALGIKSRKDYIPFGPFIAIAALICIFYGQVILQGYMNYLL